MTLLTEAELRKIEGRMERDVDLVDDINRLIADHRRMREAILRTEAELQLPENQRILEIRRLEKKTDTLLAACKEVEEWWLEQGKHSFTGAPHCIFAVREVIEKVGNA